MTSESVCKTRLKKRKEKKIKTGSLGSCRVRFSGVLKDLVYKSIIHARSGLACKEAERRLSTVHGLWVSRARASAITLLRREHKYRGLVSMYVCK